MKHTTSAVLAALIGATLLGGQALASKSATPATEGTIGIEEAIQRAQAQYPQARVVEAEFEDDDGGRWEIKLVDADNRVRKLYLDARSGEPREKGRS
jgi:uncharacterized membrane protein YkoI